MKNKKLLIISSASIHTKKFIMMLEGTYDVSILTNNTSFFNDLEGISLYRWKRNVLSNMVYTHKLLKELKPDLVHIHQIGKLAFFYIWFLHKRYRTLVTAWGSDVLVFPYQSRINHIMTRYVLNKAYKVSSIDSVGMLSVVNCLTRFNKDVVPLAFGVAREVTFVNDFDSKENIIYSPRSHKALYNIESILHAFARHVQEFDHWRLAISGFEDPKVTPRLTVLARRLGISDYVDFLGPLSQVKHAQMLVRSKVVISVPMTDGRPISVMEAMSANCLVIGSDILANHELLVEGVNGIIVNHMEDFDISVMNTIDTDLMTRFNREYIKQFSYEKAKQSYTELIRKLVENTYRR